MAGYILGIKGDMKQVFTPRGERIPVTHIDTSDCYLVDIKTQEKDGYCALLIGSTLTKKMPKTTKGKVEKAGIKTPLLYLREIRLDKKGILPTNVEVTIKGESRKVKIDDASYSPGDRLVSSKLFREHEMIAVTGVSKGKGFAGVMKRHGFAGGPRTHGQSDRERAPGSIGMSTTPGRVLKGKKMAGRMGGETVTIKNLEVIETGERFITVKGLVPGPRKGLITIINARSTPRVENEIEHTSNDVKEDGEKDNKEMREIEIKKDS